MDKHDNLVVGLTHIDLGWKKGRAEMAAMLDIYLEHLCNMLDTYPDFRYVLEQAVHYKDLKTRNLQLFERVKAYLCTGRLEFATGLASTIENNVVCAESFVRNMQIGLRWIKENFGVSVKYCTMIDTFGFPPQMPQVLRQFGYDILLANRLGGYHWEECLSVRGLDHTTLRVFGRDLVSSYVKPGHLCFRFCPDDEAVSRLFEAADRNPAPWTVVVPYTENEVVPSDQILRSMADASKEYRFASLSELTGRIREMQDIPEASADLNPEFSGTFSLRHKLRIINRICEKALLDAEAVQAMLLSEEGGDQIEECWWEMAYTQFHDIITGSHPTAVYLDCLCRMEKVQQCARQVMENTLLFCGANQAECCLTLVNTLPYSRKEEIRWELPWGWEGVRQVQLGDEMVEHRQSDHVILFDAEIPAMSMCPVYMEPGPAAAVQLSSLNCLENEYYRIELGKNHMIDGIFYKPAMQYLIHNADDILCLQEDQGNFQIEEPAGAPIPCAAGTYSVKMERRGDRQIAYIKGQFPKLGDNAVGYCLELSLRPDQPFINLHIRVDWQAQGMRLRLNIPTPFQAAGGWCEVPFGVAERKPYGITKNGRGEWPALRFAAIEGQKENAGVGLINTGVPGVEFMGGSILSTLLRAPTAEYGGMKPDDTSSDHGQHIFRFALYGYQGDWRNSGLPAVAQAVNHPVRVIEGMAVRWPAYFSYDNKNVLLSAFKRAGDGRTALRLYESTGQETTVKIRMMKPVQAWRSDLREMPLEPIPRQLFSMTIPRRLPGIPRRGFYTT